MDQLKQAVATAFDNIVASGAIEKAIQEQIGKCVESAIKDQFSSYGDFNKAVKAKVSELVDVNLAEIDLPSYRDLVGKIIRERVGAAMHSNFAEQLGNDLDELLSPAPAEITLEKLLQEFVEARMDAWDADDLRGNPFTLEIDSSRDGYADIYLDKEPRQSRYSCEFQIRVRDGVVWALRIDGKDPRSTLFAGPLFNFEMRLFQMYTARTKLIVKEGASGDDFDTYFPEHGDDY